MKIVLRREIFNRTTFTQLSIHLCGCRVRLSMERNDTKYGRPFHWTLGK